MLRVIRKVSKYGSEFATKNKPIMILMIEANFLPKIVYTAAKKKNHTQHCKINSSDLRFANNLKWPKTVAGLDSLFYSSIIFNILEYNS